MGDFLNSTEAFGICLGFSLIYYLASNVYLIVIHFRIAKMIRESGQIVSNYPMLVIQNVSMQQGPYRPDIVSPDGMSAPPSYNETAGQHQFNQGQQPTNLDQVPPFNLTQQPPYPYNPAQLPPYNPTQQPPFIPAQQPPYNPAQQPPYNPVQGQIGFGSVPPSYVK